MRVLNARDAYRRWAPTYSDETAISFLEDQVVSAITPPLAGLRLCDAGCGTGRRLEKTSAALAVGVDLSPRMLEFRRHDIADSSNVRVIVGDVRDLPLPDKAFDVVWCRLVIGHLADCSEVYGELARVSDVGGSVIVTDFHPSAVAAGHRRTFRDEDQVLEVEHHVHGVPAHLVAARTAGLDLTEMKEGTIGPCVVGFYERAGRSALYQAHLGLPVVLGLAFRRAA